MFGGVTVRERNANKQRKRLKLQRNHEQPDRMASNKKPEAEKKRSNSDLRISVCRRHASIFLKSPLVFRTWDRVGCTCFVTRNLRGRLINFLFPSNNSVCRSNDEREKQKELKLEMETTRFPVVSFKRLLFSSKQLSPTWSNDSTVSIKYNGKWKYKEGKENMNAWRRCNLT